MKKFIVFFCLLGLFTNELKAQDSLKTKLKKTGKKIGETTKKVVKSSTKFVDTAAKKTGVFVKKNSNEIASRVAGSRDKSLKGPNGEAVFNGPRGGKYYINASGNKVYLKKDAPGKD